MPGARRARKSTSKAVKQRRPKQQVKKEFPARVVIYRAVGRENFRSFREPHTKRTGYIIDASGLTNSKAMGLMKCLRDKGYIIGYAIAPQIIVYPPGTPIL